MQSKYTLFTIKWDKLSRLSQIQAIINHSNVKVYLIGTNITINNSYHYNLLVWSLFCVKNDSFQCDLQT